MFKGDSFYFPIDLPDFQFDDGKSEYWVYFTGLYQALIQIISSDMGILRDFFILTLKQNTAPITNLFPNYHM